MVNGVATCGGVGVDKRHAGVRDDCCRGYALEEHTMLGRESGVVDRQGGTVGGRTFVDAVGNPLREVTRGHPDGPSAANGGGASIVVRQVDHFAFDAAGSVTVASTGTIGRTPRGATIGRVVAAVPADRGGPTVKLKARRNTMAEYVGPIRCGRFAP